MQRVKLCALRLGTLVRTREERHEGQGKPESFPDWGGGWALSVSVVD